MAKLATVSESSFEQEVLLSELPVLVDFWAPWCGPCGAVTPILEQLNDKYHQKIKMVKINVDEAQGLARRYNVKAIPTLMIFKSGASVDTKVGADPAISSLSAFIDRNI